MGWGPLTQTTEEHDMYTYDLSIWKVYAKPSDAQYDEVENWTDENRTAEDIQRKCWDVAEGAPSIALQLCKESGVPLKRF